MLRTTFLILSALTLGAVAGCGGGGGGGGDTAASVDPQYEGAIASNDVAHGEEVYNNVCMACHASGPALENIAWTAAAVRQKVREGGSGMSALPASRLSDDDLEAVLAYMTTNGGVAEELSGDTSGGEEAMPGDDEPEPLMDEEEEALE
jgi:mono/diheme cytochrome c family protein